MSDSKVFIQDCNDYNSEIIYKKLCRIFEQMRFKVPKGSTVLLKPNILSAVEPSKSITTHPEMVRAVVKYFKKQKCKITISDSSSDTGNSPTNRAFIKTGMKKIAKQEKVDLVSFEATKQKKVKTKGKVLKNIMKSELLLKSDMIINLPKMKTHSLTGLTGSIKNMYGTLSGSQKQKFHYDYQPIERFSELIIDIYEANKPTLNIMDAIVCLEGNGPGTGGHPKKVGKIIVSENGYALDYIQQKIMGFKSNTSVIEQAVKRGYLNKEEVEVIGEYSNLNFKKPVTSSNAIKDLLPSFIVGYAFKQLQRKPVFNNKCTKCAECIKICPVDALKMGNTQPKLNKNRCISCHCCHEVCRYTAVLLKPNLMGKIINKIAELANLT
ncbi:MAG: Coenzyme F420 hydrogenase subunit gamma [Candidatus Woesearchaeota archaeon]|nr:Coenzyme F420 hydrogenase subunit gamma [Candidatus Woesearchaeota archaeon]